MSRASSRACMWLQADRGCIGNIRGLEQPDTTQAPRSVHVVLRSFHVTSAHSLVCASSQQAASGQLYFSQDTDFSGPAYQENQGVPAQKSHGITYATLG